MSSPITIGITGEADSPVSKPSAVELALHVLGVLPELLAALGLALDDLERLARRGDRRRRRRRREDLARARVAARSRSRRAVAGDEAADRGERLRERAHHEVDVGLAAEVLGRAAAVLAEDAEAVRVVHHQARAEALLQRDDLRQRRRGRPPSRTRRPPRSASGGPWRTRASSRGRPCRCGGTCRSGRSRGGSRR